MAEPLVFQPGVAQSAFHLACGGWAAFEFGMAIRQRRRSAIGLAIDRSDVVLGAAIAGSVLAAVEFGHAALLPWPGWPGWPVTLGIAMILAGVMLRAWSIATLGRFFQYRIAIQPEHQVITGGPYRFVRHPSYSGLALALLGIALAIGDVLSIAATICVAGAGIAVRIDAEERQLAAALGSAYERFAATRKRVLPGVW